jgi:3-hydroxybutyryl-CoA dehydrogenase
MGTGIAQVAACAGHRVLLADARPGVAAQAAGQIKAKVVDLVARGKLRPAVTELNLQPAELTDFGDCGLVIEAVTERLDVKTELLRELESVVSETALLATNTSSLSVAAIASHLDHPARFLGLHFFNPVPLMKLVEVVSGPATDPVAVDEARAIVQAWEKKAVISAATPGFIVNRVARPFYAESWRLLDEQAAPAEVIDRILVAAGGFRMGPFALMDLIGHDVNEAVTRTVWEAYGYDPRFSPSLAQRLLVESGRLGRKSGQGVYRYAPGSEPPTAQPAAAQEPPAFVEIPARSDLAPLLGRAAVPAKPADRQVRLPGGTILVRCDGRPATALAAELGGPVVVVDRCLDDATATGVAVAASAGCGAAGLAEATGLLQAAGLEVYLIADVPGLVVTRTVAMLVNLALDAVEQQVASAADVDVAMKLGTGYPVGPGEWGERWGGPAVLAILDALSDYYRDGHHRPSPALRRRELAGSLTR